MKKLLIPIFLLVVCSLASCKKEEMIIPPEVKEASQVDGSSFNAQWCYTDGAREYLLCVSEHEDFKDHLTDYDGKTITHTSHKVEGLKEYTPYYYRVKAVGKDMTSEYSQVMKVKLLGTDDLQKPHMYEPGDLSYDGFRLAWDMVPGAEMFYLDIAKDKGFNDYVDGYHNKEVSQLHHMVNGLNEETKYYCRVKAAKGSKYSEYSNVVWILTPKKSCRVVSLIQRDYQGVLNQAYDADIKVFYDEHGRPSSVCQSTSILEGDYKQAYNYYYEYDEQDRLISMLDKAADFIYTITYNGDGKVSKVKRSPQDYIILDYAEHSFTYVDDRHFIEIIEKNKNGVSTKTKKKYTLDHLGNIIHIYLSEYENNQWVDKMAYHMTYDDKRYPKDYHLLFNREILKYSKPCVPETHIPFWYSQVCNVLTYKEEYMNGDYNEVKYDYTYNDCKHPVRRSGNVYFSDQDYFTPDCSLKYSYSDCDGHEDTNGTVAKK